MSWLHLFSARIIMAKAAQQQLAPDWAISRDFDCSTHIVVDSVAKALTPQPPSG